MSEDWRADLAAAVAQGMAEEGWDAVVDVLGELGEDLAAHPDAPIEPLAPDVAVLALAGCASGCLGILVDVGGRLSVHLGRTAEALLAQVAETVQPGLVAITGGVSLQGAAWEALAVQEVEPYAGAASLDERREHLRLAGVTVPAWFSGSGFTEAELLDACGAVVVALGRAGRMEG